MVPQLFLLPSHKVSANAERISLLQPFTDREMLLAGAADEALSQLLTRRHNIHHQVVVCALVSARKQWHLQKPPGLEPMPPGSG